jgi:hypothetical protein
VTWSVVGALAAAVFLSLALLGAEADRWSADRVSGDVGGRTAMALELLAASTRDVGTLFFGLGNSASFDLLGVYPHIVALEILGEEGLLGLALFIALLAVMARRLFGLLGTSARAPADRAVFAALLASVVFHLLLSFKQGSLLGSPYLLMHAMLVGRMAGARASPIRAREDAAGQAAALRVARFPNVMR